ncbi:FAD binding domain-containing protein [Sphaerisporangium dianthi]|uniref:FAD binding domain-containing protein n=1 Tax=Sphaerisporangium dianthi TaxID=1436120 RepID=A0ABV9CF85_9ACTN
MTSPTDGDRGPITSATGLAGIAAVARRGGELRAGGTDLMSRPSRGPHVDLRGRPELSGVTWRADGAVRIGALTTIAALATDERIGAAHPSLALTAAGLATPQIRAMATVGGNLLQRNRCAYFRNAAFSCFQSGGDGCPARGGLTLRAAVVHSGPCVAPHPSSLAMALLGCEATVEVHGGETAAETHGEATKEAHGEATAEAHGEATAEAHGEATAETYGEATFPVAELYGDGADPTRDHLLAPGAVLLAVVLPAPRPGERAAYHRATARSHGEWPLVEVAVRLVVDGERVVFARVAAGGVARVPLRLPEVENALLAGEPLERAAALAAARCTPTPQNAYKVALLTGTVLSALEQARQPSP